MSRKIHLKRSQQGSALIIAIFTIIIMSILGLGLANLLSKSSDNLIVEVYGAQAHYAAQSGADVFLTELYKEGNEPTNLCTDRADSSQKPRSEKYFFRSKGLENCNAAVSCTYLNLETYSSSYSGIHFRIKSQGYCSINGQKFSRELILEARDEN